MSGIREFSDKKLIVGLGNPGRKYAKTRHNIGWWVLNELARRYNLEFDTKERKSITASGTIKNHKVILAKPQTYMNLSGEAVRALLDFYKISLDNLIVIYDEIDLPLGTLRIRKSGGHGGHNGMRNIIQHLGTRNFDRIRFGVSRPPGKMEAVSYVLMQFSGDDEILARETVDRAASAIELWLTDGIEVAMTEFNGNAAKKQEPQLSPREQLALYQRAHELNPNDPKPLEKMIPLLQRIGKIEDAAYTHLKLANLFMEQDKPKLVIRNWERAAELKPSYVDVQQRIADAYEKLDDKKRAVNRYLRLAEYYESVDNFEKALQSVEEAIRVNPQHPRAIEKLKALQPDN